MIKLQEEEKNYKAYIICRNCDYGLPYLSMYGGKETKIPLGTKVENTACPNCGCKELYNSKPR